MIFYGLSLKVNKILYVTVPLAILLSIKKELFVFPTIKYTNVFECNQEVTAHVYIR